MAQTDSLPNIGNYNFEELTQKLIDSLRGNESPELITKFLCGIYTPKFTTIKAKGMPSFGKLERYRYQEILNWVKKSR